jgi:hypothetical protein
MNLKMSAAWQYTGAVRGEGVRSDQQLCQNEKRQFHVHRQKAESVRVSLGEPATWIVTASSFDSHSFVSSDLVHCRGFESREASSLGVNCEENSSR